MTVTEGNGGFSKKDTGIILRVSNFSIYSDKHVHVG